MLQGQTVSKHCKDNSVFNNWVCVRGMGLRIRSTDLALVLSTCVAAYKVSNSCYRGSGPMSTRHSHVTDTYSGQALTHIRLLGRVLAAARHAAAPLGSPTGVSSPSISATACALEENVNLSSSSRLATFTLHLSSAFHGYSHPAKEPVQPIKFVLQCYDQQVAIVNFMFFYICFLLFSGRHWERRINTLKMNLYLHVHRTEEDHMLLSGNLMEPLGASIRSAPSSWIKESASVHPMAS